MADFISREAAEQFICEACERPGRPRLWGNDCEIIYRLNTIHAADVRPVVHGRWEIANSFAGPGLMNLRCSACGAFGGTWKDNTLPSMLYNFCPHCGADMREPNLDTTKGENHD
jgi:hypothetical protein